MTVKILNGNELIVQGALEAGFSLYTGYPGSPLADFFNILNRKKKELSQRGIKVVIANSEANAAAMASGAKQAGRDCLVAMKSMGLHVASDALSVGNFADPGKAGVVIAVGDDPWSISTSTPADSRYLFKHLHIPFLEPSTPQELKDWMSKALELSKESSVYCGILLTTFMAEGGGRVEVYSEKEVDRDKKKLNPADFDLSKNVMVPPNSLKADTRMILERFPKAIDSLKKVSLDQKLGSLDSSVGMISSGVIFQTLKQVLEEENLLSEVSLYKIASSFPLVEDHLLPWLKSLRKLVVVEEKRGFLEGELCELAQKHGLTLEIIGKRDRDGELFPAFGGLTYEHIKSAVNKHLTQKDEIPFKPIDLEMELPKRLPTFCPGCPHRETLSLLKDLRRNLKEKNIDLITHGDVGCYSLSFLPPFKEMHNLSAMGQGGALGAGVDLFTENPSIVLMGDSTFFHSGLTDISNSIQSGHNITYILLDNDNTAMTGHQMTPASGVNVEGSTRPRQEMLNVVRSLGVDYSTEVNPSDRYFYKNLLQEVIDKSGVKVIVSNKECALTFHGRRKKEERKLIEQRPVDKKVFYQINTDACEDCRMCVEETGCPGLTQVFDAYGTKVAIDPQICVNDSYCTKIKVCPSFEKVEVSSYHPSLYKTDQEIRFNEDELPEPTPIKSFEKISEGNPLRIVVTGVGGSGVTTISRVLAEASKEMGGRDDLDFKFVDQKGLAQRNGNVTAHLSIYPKVTSHGPVVPLGKADLLVSPDLLDGASNLRFLSKDGQLVIDKDYQVPLTLLLEDDSAQEPLKAPELRKKLKEKLNNQVHLFSFKDLSYELLGKSVYASAMCLGTCFQLGLFPFSYSEMEQALKRAVPKSEHDNNLKAFNIGRYISLYGQEKLVKKEEDKSSYLDLLKQSLSESLLWYLNKSFVLKSFEKNLEKLMRFFPNVPVTYLAQYIHDIYIYDRGHYIEEFISDAGTIAQKYQDESERSLALQILARTYFIKDEVFVAHMMISPMKRKKDQDKYGVIGKSYQRTFINRPSFDLFGKKVEFDISPKVWMLKIMRHMRLLRVFLGKWHLKEKKISSQIRDKILVEIPRLNASEVKKHLREIDRVKGYREVRYKKAKKIGLEVSA